MNHLFIIGNGFDLAHGLPTRYSNFLKKNLLDEVKKASKFRGYVPSDYALFQVRFPNFLNTELTKTFNENPFLLLDNEFIEANGLSDYNLIKCRSSLLNEQYHNFNWIDIEKAYFDKLVSIINDVNSPLWAKKDRIIKLNDEIDLIKMHFISYINSLRPDFEKRLNPRIMKHFEKIYKSSNENQETDTSFLFLNFNYTHTYYKYIHLFKDLSNELGGVKIINIHGLAAKVELENNDLIREQELRKIILGYGDEYSEAYKDILSWGEFNMVRHFKSFSYLLSPMYSELNAFSNSGNFVAHVMGHSLGKSDKVLLKGIFENKNCLKIKIYYKDYQDFTSKVFNAASVFDDPQEMREKIENFQDCDELAPNDH